MFPVSFKFGLSWVQKSLLSLFECGEEIVDLSPHDYPQTQHQATYHWGNDGHQQVYEEGHECPTGEGYDHHDDADHV
jgi:hypothetical protein